MKKKFLILMACVTFFIGQRAFSDTTTSRFGLTKPDIGSTNWGPKLNTNSDTIDAGAAGQTITNTFTATNTFNNTVAVTTISVTQGIAWPNGYTQKNSFPVFDLRDYGAKCDGSTDDYTAIQNAFNAAHAQHGGTVVASSGTCIVGTRLVIYSSTTLTGPSTGACTFKAKSTLTTKMLVNQAWGGTGGDTNIQIRNMIFDEAGSTHGGSDDTSVTFARVDNTLFYRCRFINGTSGLFLLTGATYDDNHHVYFVECVWDSSNLIAGGTDINDFGNGKDIQIIRSVFLGGYTNSGNVQVSAAGMDNFIIQGSYFDGQGNANPMNILGIHGGGMFDSFISSSNGRCVNISQFNEGNPKRTMIDWKLNNNTYDHCGDMAVWLSQNFSSTDSVRDISITNSKFVKSGKSAINIELANGVMISGNSFDGGSTVSSGTYAVINATGVAGTTTIFNVMVTGNHFYDTSATPSQTKLFQTNFVSTFVSFGNLAENITTRNINLNTTGFQDFDSGGQFTALMSTANPVFAGVMIGGDGSVNNPTYGYSQSGNGWYHSATQEISAATNSTQRFRIGSGGDVHTTPSSSFQIDASTPSRAVVTNGDGTLISTGTTAAQVGFLGDVTSLVQAQLNTKATSSSPSFSGTIAYNSVTATGTVTENSTTTFNAPPVYAFGRFKVVVSTRALATVSGNVAITGVGFQPSAVVFIAGNGTADSWGLDTSTTRGGTFAFGASYSDTSSFSINIFDSSGFSAGQEGKINSFDSDGATIAWTKVGSPTGNPVNVYCLFFR